MSFANDAKRVPAPTLTAKAKCPSCGGHVLHTNFTSVECAGDDGCINLSPEVRVGRASAKAKVDADAILTAEKLRAYWAAFSLPQGYP